MSDVSYGNFVITENAENLVYAPVRGTLIEVEFITHPGALETVKLSTATGLAIKNKFAIDIASQVFDNIRNHK